MSTVATDKGSVSATAATLTMGTCGPVLLASSVAAADPMLIRGNTVSYAQTGPLTGGTGLGLSGGAGGTGYAAEVTAATGPGSFSEAIWFKTTGNGTLMGFTDTPAASSSTSWDHMLWVDSTGHVVFGVTTTLGNSEATSTAGGYNNGQWHFAVGTLNALAGMSVTVDGTNTSNSVSLLGALTYSGYWHVGWDNEAYLGTWGDPPTTPYFGGTLADAAVFPVLTAAQVSALYAAGTQPAWNALLTADGATGAWMLGDSGATPYTGTVPRVTPAACNFVDVTIGATATTCAAPANASAACAVPSAGLRFGGLSASLPITPPLTTTTPLTITITIARDPTITVAANPYALGLHLTATKALVATNSSFSATLDWPSENVIL